MKTIRALTGGLGLWGVALLSGVAAAADSGNDLTWTSDTVKVALGKPGGEAVGECEFVNRSGSGVRILKIVPSCGCTAAKSEKLLYQPGESGTIKLSFKGGARVGMQREEVYVLTSGSETPKRLVMEINIRRSLALSADSMIWNQGETGEKEVILSSDAPFELKSANSTNDGFQITTKGRDNGREWVISVHPLKSDQSGDGIVSLSGRFPDGRVENIGMIVAIKPGQ